MNRLITTSLLLALCLTAPLGLLSGAKAEPFKVNGKAIPQTVAKVNGVPLDSQLLISEIKVYRLMNRQKNKTLTEQELSQYSHQALSRLVDQELIYQKGKKMKIKIATQLLEKRIQDVREQFPSETLFKTALDLQGLTLDLLKIKFEKQMVEERIIREDVVPKVKVGDPEVEAFYQKNLSRFATPEQYETHHIFTAALQASAHDTPIEDPAARKKAKRLNDLVDQDASEKINNVHRQLKQGGDFAKLAREQSEDNETSPKGGSWGAVNPDELPDVLAKTLRALKQNKVSQPVRSAYGYHILKWSKKIPASHRPLAEVKSDIMNVLLREKTLSEHKKMVSQMRKRANIKLFYK